MIYLDNNATTPIDATIAHHLLDLQLRGLANPASQHRAGRQALRLLEDAKSELIEWLSADSSGSQSAQVILTSGGTEANNLAIHGFAAHQPGYVIVAGTEHASVIDAARELGPDRSRTLPVDQDGRCDLETLSAWLDQDAPRIRLVSVMHGNNETGVIQDVPAICQLCQTHGVPVHSDAVQSVGKIDINFSELGLSALSISAHKLHGPVGVGALLLRADQHLTPMMVGGGQQLGLRPGTESVVLAAGLAMAVRLACQARRTGEYDRLAVLRDRFESQLASLTPLRVIASLALRLPHVSNIAFRGLDRQALQMAFDLAGLACSTGSACASGSSRPSHVLQAMGLDAATIGSSIRFSFSRFTTAEEVDSAAQIVGRVVQRLRGK